MKKTGLDQTVSIHFGSNDEPWLNASGFEGDPRWQLVQRVIESAQFSKSPRLSSFLLYIVAKSLEGRQSEITEQQIGVHVFGRPLGYRTVDDNIVRNYACFQRNPTRNTEMALARPHPSRKTHARCRRSGLGKVVADD